MKSWKAFSLVFCGASVALLCAAVGFTCFVDPYGLAGSPARVGWNVRLPLLAFNTPLIKALGLRRERFDTVLLGSSIVDAGYPTRGSTVHEEFRPPAAALAPVAEGIYNAGIRGGGTRYALRYLRHAREQNPHLKRAILNLEWGLFTSATLGGRPLEENDFLRSGPFGWLGYRKYMSWEAFNDAARTVQANRGVGNPQGFGDLGALWRMLMTPAQAAPADHGLRLSQDHSVMARTTAETRALYFALWVGQWLKADLASNGVDRFLRRPSLDDVSAIVAFAKQHDIELKVVVSPQHPAYWVVMRELGLWPAHLQWLRELAKITPYYDLSAEADFAEEADRFFPTDPLHFVPALGARLLPLLLEHDRAPVTENHIETSLAERTRRLEQWMRRNPYLGDAMAALKMRPRPASLHQILPALLPTADAGLRIIRLLDRVYALPVSEEPYDLLRLAQERYPDMVSAATLGELQQELARRPLHAPRLVRLPPGDASSSETHPASRLSHALDGNPATLWISGAAGSAVRGTFVSFRLPAPAAIRRVVLHQIDHPDFRQDTLMVQASDDGEVWTDVLAEPPNLFGRARGVINIPERAPVRHWRIVVPTTNKTDNARAWAVQDVELYVAQAGGE